MDKIEYQNKDKKEKDKLNDTYLLDFLCKIIHENVSDYTYTDKKEQSLEIDSFDLISEVPGWYDTKNMSKEEYKEVINALIDRILSR